jgi:hypothetical protein
MAWPPFQSPARAKPEASDLGSVTFGSPLDPVVGGSLEDAFCGLISWCIAHVQLASANIKCHTHVPSAYGWDYVCLDFPGAHQVVWIVNRKGTTSSAGSAQVLWQPHGAQA